MASSKFLLLGQSARRIVFTAQSGRNVRGFARRTGASRWQQPASCRSAAQTATFTSTTKMSHSDDYELIYWPGIPGRGEPIRLLFEETGTPYRDVAKEKDGVNALLGIIKPEYQPSDGNIPPLAPPILRCGTLLLAQSPNILLFLGERLPGLIPGDVQTTKYIVNQLVLTALDLQNEIHDTHHPVGNSLYYEDQKPEAKRKAEEVRNLRIPKFFEYFDRVIAQTDGPYLLAEFSYADLVLWHVVDGAKFAFPQAVERQFAKSPRVKALHAAVAGRARIAAYLGSERRAKYSNGIYRYYAELDE